MGVSFILTHGVYAIIRPAAESADARDLQIIHIFIRQRMIEEEIA